jgi:hypothetical protein
MVSPDGIRSDLSLPVRLMVEQSIPPTAHVAEKLHNLELARRRMDCLLIPPGGVFSFWHLIGPPSPKRGFQAGRSLLGGKLRVDYGGGLCQLSGAVYHLSLRHPDPPLWIRCVAAGMRKSDEPILPPLPRANGPLIYQPSPTGWEMDPSSKLRAASPPHEASDIGFAAV